MLANQLINTNFPTVDPDDKIFLALQLIDDFDLLHIAVVDHNKYLGIISKDDLLDADDSSPVKVLMNAMLQKSVKAGEHFLSADTLPDGAVFDPSVHGHRSAQVGDHPLETLFIRL